jgi:hypothetical protein
VEPLALAICVRFVPLCGHPDCSPDCCMPCIPGGRFSTVLLQRGGGLVLSVLCGRGRLPDRPASSHHGAGEAVTECAPPVAG